MSHKAFNNYHPEIIGLDWAPGNLILVASRSWGGKSPFHPAQNRKRMNTILMQITGPGITSILLWKSQVMTWKS